jgi:hypothetical protein
LRFVGSLISKVGPVLVLSTLFNWNIEGNALDASFSQLELDQG